MTNLNDQMFLDMYTYGTAMCKETTDKDGVATIGRIDPMNIHKPTSINLDQYRHNIPGIIAQWRKERPDEDFITSCGGLALYTSCPIIAVAYFLGELESFSPELLAYIKRLEDFYK